MKVLVTGAAGFIGFHAVCRLLERGDEVVGVDSLNDYYDVSLKEARLRECGVEGPFPWGKPLRSATKGGYTFIRMDIAEGDEMAALFHGEKFHSVLHLAAQAGVRYSLVNPWAYVRSNVEGTLAVLEGCRAEGTTHLVYASSSSVYGLGVNRPYRVEEGGDHPVSLYAATKRSCELLAHSYSHLYGIPSTGLRYFTVYGPWGRPDMALMLFVKAILEGSPIQIFGNGDMERDFTYVDDIVEGTLRVLNVPPSPDPSWDPSSPEGGRSSAPYRVYNIGCSSPVRLMTFIETVESCLGKKAVKEFLPMQAGDVRSTWADVSPLEERFGYRPSVPVEEGVRRFVEWYRRYYAV
jgi:UDP-glucuronate 4-epimerase